MTKDSQSACEKSPTDFIRLEKVPNQFTRNIPPGDFIRRQKVADQRSRGDPIISTYISDFP